MKTRRERFDAYREIIREASRHPFAYGTNDCVLLVAAAVQRINGVDYTAEFLPYDMRKAQRLIRKAGGLVQFISQFLGAAETDIERIRVCDAAVVSAAGQEPAAGLWNGSSVTCLAPSGAVGVAANHIDVFWRIG